MEEEDLNQYVLEVECPRFMDTSLIDCDVQPTHIRVTIKGKVRTYLHSHHTHIAIRSKNIINER